jgi:hypothetical protein
MDQRRDPFALMLDYGDRLARAGCGKLDTVPPLIDVSARFGQPVRDRQRPVTQGMREPGP